jgi:hypothetical protein
VKSPDPTNCSFQVGSLTVGAHGNMRARRTVTKPPEGKSVCYGRLWPVPKALFGNGEKQDAGHLRQGEQMTRSQSERQGKEVGRRITNHIGIVKVSQMKSGMSGDCEGRPAVLSGKPVISVEGMGESTQRPCRCKSGRHILKHLLGNWRGSDRSHKVS